MLDEIFSFLANVLIMFKELLLVLVGGLCAAFGGFFATWYLAKNSRRIRREEIIGEKQVEVYQKAARLSSQIQSLLIQGTLEDARKFVQENSEWFCDNRLFLPQGFQDKWISIKSNLNKAVRLEKKQGEEVDEKKRGNQIDKLGDLESFIRELAQAAEKVVLEELDLRPIEIEKFLKKKQEE